MYIPGLAAGRADMQGGASTLMPYDNGLLVKPRSSGGIPSAGKARAQWAYPDDSAASCLGRI